MKTKTLNKLNNVLKGLELSKEQKQMLVEVFDEIGSDSATGGGSEFKYVDINPDTGIVTFNGVQYQCDIVDKSPTFEIINEQLYNELNKDIKPIILTGGNTTENAFIFPVTSYIHKFNTVLCSVPNNIHGLIHYAFQPESFD